jgi:hypothetical protein
MLLLQLQYHTHTAIKDTIILVIFAIIYNSKDFIQFDPRVLKNEIALYCFPIRGHILLYNSNLSKYLFN